MSPAAHELIPTSGDATLPATRALLASGAVAGPFFTISVVLQILTRPGFDIRRHPISLLSLGDLGWIQIATFVLTGLAIAAAAVGMRRALPSGRGAVWGPPLVGLFGLGLIAAGFFTADPSMGFPPGTAASIPDHLSWHSALHGVAFFTSFTALVAACFVFARRFAGLRWRGWVAYCVASGVVAPTTVVLGMSKPRAAAVPFALAALVAFGWLTTLTVGTLAEVGRQPR